MADETISLADYLVAPTTSAPAEVVAAEIIPNATPAEVVQEIIEQNPTEVLDEMMKDLMGKVKRIGMCAKDLHYRANGKPFYGLHLLSDLVYQVEEDTDHIAEIYFMGDRGIEPPSMTEVYKRAIEQHVGYPRNNRYFVGGLMNICRSTMHFIESIKKSGDIKSGVAAVLDKISEHCLLAIGLLDQTMKGA